MSSPSRPPWLYPIAALALGGVVVGGAWAFGAEDPPVDIAGSAAASQSDSPEEGAGEGMVEVGGNSTEETSQGANEEEPSEEVDGLGDLNPLDGADPFSRPLPDALQELATRLEEAPELDREAHRETRLYQRLHPADPRPTLLLAHDLADRASWPQAVERYELAYSRWPETMGDPRMVTDLIQALVQGEEDASHLLLLAFGEDAVPAVEERLAYSEHRPTRLLLRRLVLRLEAERSD